MKAIEMVRDGKFTIFSAAVPAPKVRKTWGQLRPVTRVKPSMTLYRRRPKFSESDVREV